MEWILSFILEECRDKLRSFLNFKTVFSIHKAKFSVLQAIKRKCAIMETKKQEALYETHV